MKSKLTAVFRKMKRKKMYEADYEGVCEINNLACFVTLSVSEKSLGPKEILSSPTNQLMKFSFPELDT